MQAALDGLVLPILIIFREAQVLLEPIYLHMEAMVHISDSSISGIIVMVVMEDPVVEYGYGIHRRHLVCMAAEVKLLWKVGNGAGNVLIMVEQEDYILQEAGTAYSEAVLDPRHGPPYILIQEETTEAVAESGPRPVPHTMVYGLPNGLGILVAEPPQSQVQVKVPLMVAMVLGMAPEALELLLPAPVAENIQMVSMLPVRHLVAAPVEEEAAMEAMVVVMVVEAEVGALMVVGMVVEVEDME